MCASCPPGVWVGATPTSIDLGSLPMSQQGEGLVPLPADSSRDDSSGCTLVNQKPDYKIPPLRFIFIFIFSFFSSCGVSLEFRSQSFELGRMVGSQRVTFLFRDRRSTTPLVFDSTFSMLRQSEGLVPLPADAVS